MPWWESDAPPGSGKRQPGRRRPRSASDEPPADFEVFNRSSGAAWSSAARAHFRRSTSDMASGAAEPYAHRWTTPDDGTRRIRRDPSASPAGQGGPTAASPPRSGPPSGQGPGSRTASRPGPDAHPAYGRPGTRPGPARPIFHPAGAETAETGATRGPSAAPSGRPRTLAARPTAFRSPAPWPTLPERLVYAGLAWIPLALLVAFGGGAVSGCDTASVACPAIVPPLQAALLLAFLLALLVFPRVAYLATGAGAGMIVAGLAALFLSAAGGVLTFSDAAAGVARSPSAFTAALVVAVMLVAYAVAGLAVWRDRPLRRPWLDRPLRRPVGPAPDRGSRP